MFSQSQFNTLTALIHAASDVGDILYLDNSTVINETAQLVSETTFTMLQSVIYNIPFYNINDAYDIIASNNYWNDIHYDEVTYTNYVSNPLPAVIECQSYGT
ncbi:unnamed protein product [Adineta steineri]|uniref:Uncharacterized protein n=1 Tax=Adineta steineri TaxID=433720 RepID=A0A819P8B2_9BILA|nr:unnamed protein product [Adineta steineri]CAF4006464.1 unnamed protein product [Adineta steineri]